MSDHRQGDAKIAAVHIVDDDKQPEQPAGCPSAPGLYGTWHRVEVVHVFNLSKIWPDRGDDKNTGTGALAASA